jgi:Fe2+ or Zn2+ uptake regulation protein
MFDSIGRSIGRRCPRNRHGSSLNYYILESIGRSEIMFHDLYPIVVDSYGSVSSRTIHRRLNILIEKKLIEQIIIRGNSEVYYRLSKTVKNR